MQILARVWSTLACVFVLCYVVVTYELAGVSHQLSIPIYRFTSERLILILAPLVLAAIVIHAMRRTTLAAAFLVICLSASAVLLICCFPHFRLPGYSGRFYWFTLPHLILAPLAAASVVIHAMRPTSITFRSSYISVLGQFLTWAFAVPYFWNESGGEGAANWIPFLGFYSLVLLGLGAALIRLADGIYRGRA